MATQLQPTIAEDYRHGFHDSEEKYVFKSDKGLTREIVARISAMKNEPDWMRDFRLKAFDVFASKPMPTWGDTALLSEIDFGNIHYFVRSTDRTERSWDDVPEDIKRTFDRLGIPEAERKFLAGVSAQYESEVVYHNTSKELEALKERAIKSGFDFIDFWAIDFDWHPEKPFSHHWQDYRTRKDRSLKIESDAGYRYPQRGRYTACIKVVDVFGADTSITLDIEA